MLVRRSLFLAAAVLALVACQKGAGSSDDGRPHVAFVTNGIHWFWTIAGVGAKKGGVDFDVNCDVRMPPSGVADQKRMMEDLLVRGIDGIAVSPIAAEDQTPFLNDVCESTNLITQDSDAPNSDRLCFIGVDNYDAGLKCGKLVRDALPDGGEVCLFVGRLEQNNARLRRQGTIDGILGREPDSSRWDEVSEAVTVGNFTVVATLTDQFDLAQAKSKAEDALTQYPNLACMVGLFAYNPPAILEALRGADKLGKVKVVGFDEDTATLQGIKDGTVVGTISQQPYKYGYESVRILAGLAKGDKSVLPEGGVLRIPEMVVTPDNVDEFWAELNGIMDEANRVLDAEQRGETKEESSAP